MVDTCGHKGKQGVYPVWFSRETGKSRSCSKHMFHSENMRTRRRFKILQTQNVYRWAPLCPNMENLNSRIIQSPIEITLLSLMCFSACFVGNSVYWKGLGILFFRIKRDPPVKNVHNWMMGKTDFELSGDDCKLCGRSWSWSWNPECRSYVVCNCKVLPWCMCAPILCFLSGARKSAIQADKFGVIRGEKLECLVALCCTLLHPQNLSTQDGMKHTFFSQNDSCLKLPELPTNHVSGGGVGVGVGVGGVGILPRTDNRMDDTTLVSIWSHSLQQQGATEERNHQMLRKWWQATFNRKKETKMTSEVFLLVYISYLPEKIPWLCKKKKTHKFTPDVNTSADLFLFLPGDQRSITQRLHQLLFLQHRV